MVVATSTTVAGVAAAAALVATLGGTHRDASDVVDPADPPSSTASPTDSPIPGGTQEVALSEPLTTLGTGTVTV